MKTILIMTYVLLGTIVWAATVEKPSFSLSNNHLLRQEYSSDEGLLIFETGGIIMGVGVETPMAMRLREFEGKRVTILIREAE